MQTRGRRGGRALQIGEDRLVAVRIADPVADVWRQWRRAGGKQRRVGIGPFGLHLDLAHAARKRGGHSQPQVITDRGQVTGPKAPRRAPERLPATW